MNDTQIIFVDGPTAVGKDYLIDKFTEAYKARYPTAKVTKIRSADVVLKGEAKSEERKYTTYATPVDIVKQVYEGHVALLDILRTKSDLMSERDLIIVNRSFLTYYIYNLKPARKELIKKSDKKTVKELKAFSVGKYAIEYEKSLKGLSTMFINVVSPDATHKESINLLVNRAYQRQDSKPIQKDWFTYLIRGYKEPPEAFIKLFNISMTLESKDHQFLLNHYFN